MSIKNKEYSCSVNNLKKPTVVMGNDAIGARLLELIMMEPGDDPLHPDMGVGIRSRYRFNNEENFLMNLQNDIKKQIDKYLPELSATDVIVTNNNKVLGIIINTAEGAYVVSYNTTTNAMEAAANHVLDELY